MNTSALGNRGMTFEGFIKYANSRYRLEGRAIVEKQNTLCIPLRNGTGKIISAKYEEKATVDFMGRYGSQPIAFEAKHCSTDVISLSRVEPHQCEFLRDWCKTPGAIGFIIISFQFREFYLIPWAYWEAALIARQTKKSSTVAFPPMETPWKATGKASIRKDELPDEWKIKLAGTAAFDYLERVDKLWRKERQ